MYHTVINNQYLISVNGSLQSDWPLSTFCFSDADRAILTACQQRGANRKTFRHISAQLGNKTAQQVRGGGASVCKWWCSVSKSWFFVSSRWAFASSTSSTCFTSKSPLPVPQMAGLSASRKQLSTEGGAGGRQLCRDCDPVVLLRDPSCDPIHIATSCLRKSPQTDEQSGSISCSTSNWCCSVVQSSCSGLTWRFPREFIPDLILRTILIHLGCTTRSTSFSSPVLQWFQSKDPKQLQW